MKIRIESGLPYVTTTLSHQGRTLPLDNVIIDTGSAGTLFSADKVAVVGLKPEPNDPLIRIRGVGGAEFVYSKRVDTVSVGELQVTNLEIEIGAMDYGFDIDGILGMDFLIQAKALIDLARLEILASQ